MTLCTEGTLLMSRSLWTGITRTSVKEVGKLELGKSPALEVLPLEISEQLLFLPQSSTFKRLTAPISSPCFLKANLTFVALLNRFDSSADSSPFPERYL